MHAQVLQNLMVYGCRDEVQQRMAVGALREMLAADMEGSLSLTAVQLIADLVRRKNCMCPPHVRISLPGPFIQWMGLLRVC